MLHKLRSAPLALAYWLGVAGADERARGLVRILMFHGVPRRLGAQFERQMRYLRRHFRVVPLGAVADAVGASADGLPPHVAITFDDGLRNNVRVAYPILQKLGLPATFFVCPTLAEEGRWLWNHEARQRLKRLDAGARSRLAQEAGAPAGDVEELIGWMKALPLGRRREVEEKVRAATPRFEPTAEEADEFDIAGWDDLRGLDPGVVTIGSHTLTHAILPSLDASECEREIGASRREAEAKLQRPVDLFAYPNGDLNPAVHACARRHYRAAVTTEPRWVVPGCDPHLLPRASAPLGAVRLAWDLHRSS